MQNYVQKVSVIGFRLRLIDLLLLYRFCSSKHLNLPSWCFFCQCKQLVFEYGPLILANAEHFLETTDVCTILHACNGGKQVSVAES